MVRLVINNETVAAPDDLGQVTLLAFLRDFAGLKGTKYGCGLGLCGACTVHVDGDAVRSCQIFVDELPGRRVTTIEGLGDTAAGEGLHPVQQAWIDEAVPQCGYCQAGQIMNAVALLRNNPRPTSDDIRNEMSGNICRCGTYERIRKAIHRVALEGQNG